MKKRYLCERLNLLRRDIGTIQAYYEANMDLLAPIPPFDLYDDPWFWRTRQKQLPSTAQVEINNTIIGDGAKIHQAIIDRHSVILENSIICAETADLEKYEVVDGIVIVPEIRQSWQGR